MTPNKSILFVWALFLATAVQAREADYAVPWCASMGGNAEVVLVDGTRVDCLLPQFAVEVDFARKWAEGMGQALHYARLTGRKPAVLLILERPEDIRFVGYLMSDAERWGIPLVVLTINAYE